jgi:Na+/H+ antiporter NhaD/arsenite permease-like protein
MTEAAAVSGVIFGLDPLWLASGILVITYAAVAVERINRAIVALIGAGIMVLSGVIDQDQAIAGQDFNTLSLLIGMMLLVAIAKRSGMFQYLAIRSARAAGGHPWAVLALLTLATALLSALLDNVTTVLLIAPITLVVAEQLEVPAYPFLFAETLASNIGGTATLIGDPPNIMIGSAVGLTFVDFVVNLGPIVAIVLVAQMAINHLIWGRRLAANPEARARVMAMRPAAAIVDRALLWRSLFVLTLVVAGFIMAHWLELEAGTIALSGAALLLLLANVGRPIDEQGHRVHAVFSEVEWITIFFFVGLFAIVAGVEHAGLLDRLAAMLVQTTGGNFDALAMAVLWVSALLSAIIDNIPFVATMIPVIEKLGPTFGGAEAILPLWWTLSLGACLGGNGTLIGASANLTVAGIGERAGVPFRFVPFLLLAFPMMLMSIILCTIYVWLRYL